MTLKMTNVTTILSSTYVLNLNNVVNEVVATHCHIVTTDVNFLIKANTFLLHIKGTDGRVFIINIKLNMYTIQLSLF